MKRVKADQADQVKTSEEIVPCSTLGSKFNFQTRAPWLLGRITLTTGHGHKLAICTVVQETLTARNAILILPWFVPILPSQSHTPKRFVPKSVQRENLHNKTGKILTGNVDEHHASSRPWVSSAFWTVRRPFLDALPLSVMGSWTKRWLQTADSMNEALPKNHRKKA